MRLRQLPSLTLRVSNVKKKLEPPGRIRPKRLFLVVSQC